MTITTLMFFAAFVALVVAAFWRGPEWGIYLYVGMYFLAPWARWWGHTIPELRWMTIVSIVIIASYWLHRKKYSDVKIARSSVMRALLVLTMIMFAVTPLAVWPERHDWVMDKQWKMMLVLLIMFKACTQRDRLEALTWSYLAGITYIASVARDRGRSGGGRLDGIGSIDTTDVNDVASMLVFGVPILLFLAMEGRKLWIRVGAAYALALVLNALVLMNSRGAVLGLIVGAAGYLGATMFLIKRAFIYKLKVVAAIMAGLSLFVYLADPEFWERQTEFANQPLDSGHSDAGRVYIWEAALRLAAEHPFGVGGHGFTALSPQLLPAYLLDGMPLRAVHSTFLEVLTAYGVPGFAALLWLIASSLRGVIATQRELRAAGDVYHCLLGCSLIAGLLGFLVAATFITRIYSEATFFAFLLLGVYSATFSASASVLASRQSAPRLPGRVTAAK